MTKDDPWKADHGYELQHEKKHNPKCFGTGMENMGHQIPAAKDLIILVLDQISDDNGDPVDGWEPWYAKLHKMVEDLWRMDRDLAEGDECRVCHEKRT